MAMDNLLEAFDRFMHLKKSTLKDGLKLYWAMLRASMFNGLVACILLSTMVMLSGMANGRTPPLSGGPIAWLGSALFVALFSNTLYLGALGIVRVCRVVLWVSVFH